MKQYGVKAIAALSGVSVRTLHYYDEIGLLKPANRTEAGYRYYGEKEFLRLQQILFYRELNFTLKEIQQLLDDPKFDLIKALEEHKKALLARKDHIADLLKTIDTTIHNLKKGTIMKNPEELYQGLPKEMGTTYREEAIDKFGKENIQKAEESLMQMGKDGFDKLKRDFKQLNKDLFALRHQNPESEEVQNAIRHHYKMIRLFWGTAGLENNQAEAYAGLGDMYVNDERFTMVDGEPQPEFAVFLQKAMRIFADRI